MLETLTSTTLENAGNVDVVVDPPALLEDSTGPLILPTKIVGSEKFSVKIRKL
jgi:hypothetical protein